MKYSFGVVGCGNMGGAILNGALSSGLFKPSEVAVFDLFEQKREECRALGCAVLSSAAVGKRAPRLIMTTHTTPAGRMV